MNEILLCGMLMLSSDTTVTVQDSNLAWLNTKPDTLIMWYDYEEMVNEREETLQEIMRFWKKNKCKLQKLVEEKK